MCDVKSRVLGPEAVPGPALLLIPAMKILIIDDDKVSRTIISKLLSREKGAEVSEVGSAEEAWAMLKGGYLPDVLILDMVLPGMSGEEFLSRLREGAPWRDLPTIICSSAATRELISRVARLGIKGYLLKPIAAARLRDVVREVTRKIGSHNVMESADAVMQRLELPAPDYIELLELFVQEAGRLLLDMNRAVADGKLAELRTILSTFRATAGNVGAELLAANAEKIADLLPGSENKQIAGMLAQLELDKNRTEEAIRRWVSIARTAGGPEMKPAGTSAAPGAGSPLEASAAPAPAMAGSTVG